MNLPNMLTVARIFLVPLLVSVLLTKFEGRLVLGLPVELVAAAIFGIASLTDWLDGYLARRRKQVTTLGQILDPLADKLLISATLISLVQLDLVQSWMVGVIIGREIGAKLQSFGSGAHFCLGAHLAQMEARVALTEMFKRIRGYEVDEANAVRVHSSNVRGFAHLPMTVEIA